MGKAKILSHLGGSQYSVIYYHDMTIINNKLTNIDVEIVNINNSITDLTNKISTKETELNTLQAEVNSLINALKSCAENNGLEECDSEKQAVNEKNKKYLAAKNELENLNHERSNLQIKIERLNKEKSRLQGITGEETKNIWCVDLCDRLPTQPDEGDWLNHGEVIPVDTIVGTIDIFDFSNRRYNNYILPASYARDPSYNQTLHGISRNTLSSNENGFVYNLNMRGPQATWEPKYRLATIGSITDGIANVTYSINKDNDGVTFNTIDSSSNTGIPCDYMICSSKPPFKAGDPVVVEFSGSKMLSPKIIGYQFSPQPCEPELPHLFFCPTYNGNAGWGQPFYTTDQQPVEINPPFGSALLTGDTHDQRHKMSELDSNAGTITTKFAKQLTIQGLPEYPGNKSWKGEDGRVLSWWGTPGMGHYAHRAGEGYDKLGYGNPTVYVDYPWINVGDIRHYWSDASQRYDLTLFTSNGTGFNPVNLTTLTPNVYLDGVKYTIPSQHLHDLSGLGTYLMGCAMIGDWLIYNDSDNKQVGGSFNVYLNAYNLVTTEYRLLLSFSRPWEFGTLGHSNQMPMFFSADGLSAESPTYGSENYLFQHYDIALDENNDPISASQYNNFSGKAVFYYGFKGNVVNKYLVGRVESFFYKLFILDGHAEYDCSVFLFYNGTLTYPRKYESLIISMLGTTYVYDIDTNGVVQYSTPSATYGNINNYMQSTGHKDAENVPTFSSSVFLDGIGLAISLPYHIDTHNFLNKNNSDPENERINVLFKLDGTGVDLGETLLNNSVNGNLLTVDPMVLI